MGQASWEGHLTAKLASLGTFQIGEYFGQFYKMMITTTRNNLIYFKA